MCRKIDKNQEVKEGVKIYKSYSFDEKKFFIASFVIAGLTWLINTIGMYIGVV